MSNPNSPETKATASDDINDAGAQHAEASDPGQAPLQPQPSEIDQLREALAAAQTELAQARDQFLRAKADADNARRRAQEDVNKAHKFGIERFAEALVPVKDSLDAALATQNATLELYREGIEITQRQLVSAFQKGGLIEIDPLGEKFDPHRHQAIASVPADGEPNRVVLVMQKGYLIADRVLRPALVSVSSPKPKSDSAPTP